MAKILIVTNDAWFFHSHRLPIAVEGIAQGHDVHVAALADDTVQSIEAAGCTFHAWALSPRGQSISGELRALRSLRRIIRDVQPDVVHLITIKAVIYGGMLTRWLRVPSVLYAISGIGVVYSSNALKPRLMRLVVRPLHAFAVKHPNSVVLFQNPDDRDTLCKILGIDQDRVAIIRGSGVDTKRYVPTPEPAAPPFTVLLAARLLRDKGIIELVEAASLLANKGYEIRCLIAGDFLATGNPAALTQHDIDELSARHPVTFLGQQNDIASLMANAHLVVLPSYREGLPKVLLEAAASGRAVITTDVPGCRYAIDEGVTGLLVEVRDANSLAAAIESLLLDDNKRQAMGVAGRELAEKAFDVRAVVADHLALYTRLMGQR